ncbi:hypothetical protein LXL04_036505 [Taraxacum kok-saghyz]
MESFIKTCWKDDQCSILLGEFCGILAVQTNRMGGGRTLMRMGVSRLQLRENGLTGKCLSRTISYLFAF